MAPSDDAATRLLSVWKLSSQPVRFVKEDPYPDYFFHTAVGFSRSTLLEAKEKTHKLISLIEKMTR